MHANFPDLSPVDSPRSKNPFDGVTCPALRTALREVSAEVAPRWASGDDGGVPINRVLLRLAQLLDGIEVKDAALKTAGPKDDIRLLIAIRKSLFDQWETKVLPVPHGRVVELLYSIHSLTEGFIKSAGEDIETRLTEPDAFQLVAEIAHDLRSPLTSILFLSEAIRNGHSGEVNELQQRQLGLIYSAALGLTGVANDLMTVAQDRGAGEFEEAVPFSFHQTFEALHEMVAPMAESKSIELRFGVHCFGHRLGHPGPIGRVLINLVTNAIKFTREGGSVEVVANSVAPSKVEVSVRDTGRGIPPEQMKRLFQPFQKSVGREGFFFASSGLGLTIVRRLLEGMESELEIESQVDVGTRFSFTLELPRTR